jgi:hypothetical protein
MFFRAREVLVTLVFLMLPAYAYTASPPPPPVSPDGYVVRLEALALLQTLNAELLSDGSPTLTLERWCTAHGSASESRIVAQRVPGVDKPLTEEQRRQLGVTPADPVRYRRVKLLCGTTVLLEADNWYLPGRLTPEMSKLLDTTTTLFEPAVGPLHFQRRTISAKVLWLPLPNGWEMGVAAAGEVAAALRLPPQVLEHRALLTLQDGTPFSEVVETYTGNVLAFPCPSPPVVTVVCQRLHPQALAITSP